MTHHDHFRYSDFWVHHSYIYLTIKKSGPLKGPQLVSAKKLMSRNRRSGGFFLGGLGFGRINKGDHSLGTAVANAVGGHLDDAGVTAVAAGVASGQHVEQLHQLCIVEQARMGEAALACFNNHFEIGRVVGNLEQALKDAANATTPAAHTLLTSSPVPR